ncbi:MAG: OmpA family protein [Bacteroidota bacterium]
MKSSITLFVAFLSLCQPTLSQIRFSGSSEPIKSINSPFGQNYLVLDPQSRNIAFTEENLGSGDENAIVELNYDSGNAYVFKDWLGTKGMVSPVGFLDEELYYNHVFIEKGSIKSVVIKLDLVSGEREKVLIPFLKNKSRIQSGCMSADGQFLILSLESGNTYGVEDLYVCRRTLDGTWTSSSNLGSELNSPYQEITPFLAEDDRTLFFATNRPGSAGGYDIFYSIRQDDSWRSWSKPVSLGDNVNTSGSETSFAYRDGERWAYFVSAQDSDVYGEVMRIKIEELIQKDTSVQALIISKPEAASESAREMDEAEKPTMLVVSASSYEPINSHVLVDGDTLESSSGIFSIESLGGRQIEIKAKGFFPKKVLVDSLLFAEKQKIVALSEVAEGNTIPLDQVLFKRGTADLVPGSEKELDLVVEALNDNPKMKILLKGHTDNRGDPVRNVRLSEARVKSVKAYLLNKGISPYRVLGKGFGGNQPVASNENEETRKLNRRVEFEVLAN